MTGNSYSVVDLHRPDVNLDALVRVRASSTEEPVTMWWTGDVYGQEPNTRARHLFGFVGFNVARTEKVADGWNLLSREAAFYLDPSSREIIDTWDNPWLGRRVDVLHIWNDPVNQRFRLHNPWGAWHVPVTDLNDTLVFNLDIPIEAPSALPVSQWPAHSADDVYAATELFQFYAPRGEVLDPDTANTRCTLSWTRISQFLPWMELGQRPGSMIFHCRGAKLGNWEELPAPVRERVLAENPEFNNPPSSFKSPNETSWTYFAKRRARSEDDSRTQS